LFFEVWCVGQDYKLQVWLGSVLLKIDLYKCSCGRKQTGLYLEGAGPDGVLGLGPGNISVPSLLAKAGLTRNSFSICLDENESGRIIFGDQGHVTQHSTPFLPINGDLYVLYLIPGTGA